VDQLAVDIDFVGRAKASISLKQHYPTVANVLLAIASTNRVDDAIDSRDDSGPVNRDPMRVYPKPFAALRKMGDFRAANECLRGITTHIEARAAHFPPFDERDARSSLDKLMGRRAPSSPGPNHDHIKSVLIFCGQVVSPARRFR
jgi:hypothetical protein